MNEKSTSLKDQLAAARRQVIGQLIALDPTPADQCREVYQFDHDLFCGVRFVLGQATAVWNSKSQAIAYFVDGQPFEQAGGDSIGRAA